MKTKESRRKPPDYGDYTVQEKNEFIESFGQEIADGVWDHHIRRIARLCYFRRYTIEGNEDAKRRMMNGNKQEGSLRNTPTVIADPPAPAPPQQDAAFLLPAEVKPIPKYARGGQNEEFSYQGRRWRKRNFIGRRLTFPNNLSPVALQGVTLEITGIGDKRVRVLIKSSPNSHQGKYMEAYGNQDPLFFPLRLLDPYIDPTA